MAKCTCCASCHRVQNPPEQSGQCLKRCWPDFLNFVENCAEQIDLTTRPTKLETSGRELASAIAAIRRAGGYPSGMENHHWRYTVRIDWPEVTLF